MTAVSESEFANACHNGQVLDCADRSEHRSVDAALIRRYCREHHQVIDPHGIRVRNASVAGVLDLAGLDVPFPLHFDQCRFEAAPVLDGASLYSLAFTGCSRLPGLLANGVRVRRDLDLSCSYITGGHRTSASTSKRAAIWLCEAEIGGRLLCVDTVIHADGERALQADRIRVGGTVRLLHRFTAVGELRLLGAHIDGSLDLTGASIECSDGPAVDLGDAVIGGSVFLIDDASHRRLVIHGRLDMGSARIQGQLLVRNATIKEPPSGPVGSGYSMRRRDGTAWSAPRLFVGAEVALEGACEITGGVDLSLSELSSLSVQPKCTLRAGGRTALDLTNAELRSSLTLSPRVAVQGTIRLTGARIHGDLSLRGVRLSAPRGWSLVAAHGIVVDGEVQLEGLSATGGALRFRSAPPWAAASSRPGLA
jgi:hypothetical protein